MYVSVCEVCVGMCGGMCVCVRELGVRGFTYQLFHVFKQNNSGIARKSFPVTRLRFDIVLAFDFETPEDPGERALTKE